MEPFIPGLKRSRILKVLGMRFNVHARRFIEKEIKSILNHQELSRSENPKKLKRLWIIAPCWARQLSRIERISASMIFMRAVSVRDERMMIVNVKEDKRSII